MSDARTRLERALGAQHVAWLDAPLAAACTREPGGPIPLASPADEAQLVEALKLARAEKLAVLPLGLGSKLGWCRPADRVDFALSTRALAGIIAHDPGDGTLTARAGSTLAELQRAARASGNHLTPSVAAPARATLGGVVAAGQSGFDRTRFGPLRDHLLGVSVALGDGTIAKSGGRLVKNVTGFDLHRLYCGSHGSLCVILEATLRLFPAPEREIALCAEFSSAGAALAAANAVLAVDAVKPLSVIVENVLGSAPSPVHLHVLLAARAELAEWQAERVRAVVPGAQELRAAAAGARFDELRDLEHHGGAWPDVRIACGPPELARALALLDDEGREQGALRFAVQPALALVDVRLPDKSRRAALVARARAAGLQAVPRSATGIQWAELEACELSAGELGLMRKLQQALDPHAVLAAGRMHASL